MNLYKEIKAEEEKVEETMRFIDEVIEKHGIEGIDSRNYRALFNSIDGKPLTEEVVKSAIEEVLSK